MLALEPEVGPWNTRADGEESRVWEDKIQTSEAVTEPNNITPMEII